jgi:hypothetical protein
MPPLAPHLVNVAVTDATVLDVNEHIMRPWFASFEVERLERKGGTFGS